MLQLFQSPTGGKGRKCKAVLSPVWLAWGRSAIVALVIATAACSPVPESTTPMTGTAEWRDFEGSWSAAGHRRTIALGADRRGSIIDLRGSMLLAGKDRPGLGFHSELIALVDSATGLQGRSVWTDEHGDRVYSELNGEGTATKNRIAGKIFGGTGRYTGATGSYEFSWQFVIEAEDGSIQGRAFGLKGRILPGQPYTGGVRP